MKHTNFLAAALITALILACLAAPAAAFSGVGSGTQSDPYIITTPAQMFEINNDLDGYYKLGNDIELPSTFTTIGSESSMFVGSLDGAGYTINSVNNQFIIVGTGATIENIWFTECNSLVIYAPINGVVTPYPHIKNCVFEAGSSEPNFFIAYYVDVTNCIFSGTLTASSGDTYRSSAPINIYGGSITNVLSYVDITYNSPQSGGLMIAAFGTNGESISNSVYLGAGNPGSRVAGKWPFAVYPPVTNCYALSTLTGYSPIGPDTRNGADVTPSTAATQSFYEDTLGWDFDNTWYWDSETNTPQLTVFRASIPPTITAITATPATGGQQDTYTLSVSASTTGAGGGIASYQWYYSTNSGNTWQPISGANTASYVWQPGQSISGDVLLKCLVTGADGGETDSYEAGYTNIKITVITPPVISSISVSRPLQKVNAPTTLTAIFADTQTASYQWYYSTNGGTTWQAISGATQTTAQYTPTTTGTHSIKIIATNQYGESSELSTTISVLPTYTPTPITQTTFDVSIDSSAKYQGVQQFDLSAELKALNYYTPNLAHLAHDNALYYLDSAEQEVIPVSNTTGGTISAAYIGQYTGVITDTAGNTAFYSYQSNDWQYIEQNNAQIIASTSSYAATVSGGTISIYNLNGNLVSSTATTASNLAGNDQTNVFVSYSGSTLTYYWVNGNSISSASQTLTHSITELHQITGTGNFIISTAANTYIVEITDAGVYSIITTSDTDTPLLNTQSTSINVFIGTSGNEIYIIGADGETDGTYVSGSTLMDASISKATGLYALAGGADYQVYILEKSQSSTWQLQQVVAFGSAIDYSQISTTGTYAAISTGLKLYLLEAVDVSTGTYMLQGAVIGSSGSPYAGKLITINGDQIRTDTSGRFLYPVSPGTLYTIIADTTQVEYTATNAALQQIAIKMRPNPYAQSVSYSAEYNEDTSSFEMQYNDQTGKTESVTWVIRESGNQTTVWTGTSTPGQTISWEVPFDKVFTGYQISMIADRSGSNVENVWMITPAGSQPIDIGGLDDTGKNIIFGCVLMVLAGLFGVMYSTKGALFIVLAAGVMVFLGLLTIPWEIIIVAGLLAVLALLAKGGGGS